MCIPGIGLIDEAVAICLAQLLRRRGIGACATEAEALSMAKLFALDTSDAVLICLCYLETATPAQIRYAVRRLRRKAPTTRICVLLFGEADRVGELVVPHLPADIELTGAALRDAVARVHDIARAIAVGRSRIGRARDRASGSYRLSARLAPLRWTWLVFCGFLHRRRVPNVKTAFGRRHGYCCRLSTAGVVPESTLRALGHNKRIG